MAFTTKYIKYDINLFEKSYCIYDEISWPRFYNKDIIKKHANLELLNGDT